MTDFKGMSREVFDANFFSIAAQVRAMKMDSRSWRRHRLLEVYAKSENSRHGELIAEVVGTNHGPVVWLRPEATGDPDKFTRWKQGDWTIEPLTGDPNHQFEIMGRARFYPLSEWQFVDAIAVGIRKLLV